MEIKEGDHVKFRRSSDKAVELTGTVEKLHDDEKSVDIRVDGEGEHVETASLEDVSPLED